MIFPMYFFKKCIAFISMLRVHHLTLWDLITITWISCIGPDLCILSHNISYLTSFYRVCNVFACPQPDHMFTSIFSVCQRTEEDEGWHLRNADGVFDSCCHVDSHSENVQWQITNPTWTYLFEEGSVWRFWIRRVDWTILAGGLTEDSWINILDSQDLRGFYNTVKNTPSFVPGWPAWALPEDLKKQDIYLIVVFRHVSEMLWFLNMEIKFRKSPSNQWAVERGECDPAIMRPNINACGI